MSKQQTIKRDQFELVKIKFDRKEGTIECDWIEMVTEATTTAPIPANKTFSFNPAPQLIDLLGGMDKYITKSNGYPETDLYRQKIVVNGVSISGGEKNRGCNIMATMKCENKGVIAINSPRIALKNDIFHFENDLSEDLKSLENEAWEYIFNGKRGQFSIAFKEEDETEEEDNQLSLLDQEQDEN
jgi:hypothetical protein